MTAATMRPVSRNAASATGMMNAAAMGEDAPPAPPAMPMAARNQAPIQPASAKLTPSRGAKWTRGSAGAAESAAAPAAFARGAPNPQARSPMTIDASSQPHSASMRKRCGGTAFASSLTACFVDTEPAPAGKSLVKTWGASLTCASRAGKRIRPSRAGAEPMRSLAVLTTTAAITLIGAAYAQNAGQASSAPPAGDPVAAAVQAYAAYQMDVSELRTRRINNAAALEEVIDQAVSHNRDAISRGWIAYGAQTAAQSPAFVQGVRDAAAYYGRDAVLWALSANTAYARTLRGGSDATRLVLDSASADGARVIAVADRYQEMAYTLQRQGWANSVAPQQAARVQRVRTLSRTGSTAGRFADLSPRLTVTPVSLSPQNDPTVYGGRRFWDSIRSGGEVVEAANTANARWRLDGPRGEAVNRMTSIAAIQALGATTERASAVDQLLNESRSRDCI